MNDTTRRAISRAAAALDAAGEIATVGHIAPDADALGSALGVARSALLAGKKAVTSFGEPFVFSDSFRFLPMETLVAPADFPPEPELLVAFDTASLDRLGSLADNAKKATTLVVIDHHRSNQGFGDIRVIDPVAPAAGLLAYRLLEELGWPIDAGVATALLAAIVADTGRFQYSSTTPEVLRVAADLVEAGAVSAVVGQALFESVPFGYLTVLSAVAGRAVLDGSLLWSVLYAVDLEMGGLAYEDTDPLVDHIRIAREAGVTLLIKQVDDGYKASLRSRGGVDVAAIAVDFGGGGHHNAAGFSHAGPVEDIVAAVLSRLDG